MAPAPPPPPPPPPPPAGQGRPSDTNHHQHPISKAKASALQSDGGLDAENPSTPSVVLLRPAEEAEERRMLISRHHHASAHLANAKGNVVATTASATADADTGTGTSMDWDYEDVDPAHVPVNPLAKGRLDFPPVDYVDDMCGCCCCCCFLPRCCYKRRMGSAYVLWETTDRKTGDQKVRLMCGAAWSSALITFALILGLPALAYTFLLPSLSLKWWLMAIGLWLVVFCIFVRTSCGDPGLCPRYLQPKREGWRYYHHTNSFRPPKVGFCSESNALFYEIDHFCPWMGTTIARDNLCYFYATLVCIPATAIFLMLLVIAAATKEFSIRHPH